MFFLENNNRGCRDSLELGKNMLTVQSPVEDNSTPGYNIFCTGLFFDSTDTKLKGTAAAVDGLPAGTVDTRSPEQVNKTPQGTRSCSSNNICVIT